MTSRSCHLIVWLRSVASLKTVSLIIAFSNISAMWYLETGLCSMMESKMFSLTKQNRQEKWEQGSCSQRLSTRLYCLRSYPAFHVSDFPCNVLAGLVVASSFTFYSHWFWFEAHELFVCEGIFTQTTSWRAWGGSRGLGARDEIFWGCSILQILHMLSFIVTETKKENTVV